MKIDYKKRANWIAAAVLPAVVILVASCSLVDSSDKHEGESPVPTDLTAEELADLSRERWIQNGPSNYRYRFDLTGEIDPELSRPVWITVRDDTVASAVYSLTHQEQVPDFYRRSYQVIDSLFSQIDYALEEEGPELLVARYDSELGFPFEIVIGFGAESLSMDVRDFVDLDQMAPAPR